jgi:hypothetical protein
VLVYRTRLQAQLPVRTIGEEEDSVGGMVTPYFFSRRFAG